jgi:phosphoglycolate phosphatase
MMDFLLFDLDGTLLDTGEGVTKGVAHALKHFGLDVPDRSALKCFIGPPLRDSFHRVTHLNEAQTEEAVEIFRDYYVNGGLVDSAVYPGLVPVLAHLKQTGKHLFVATSKPEPMARRILAHFELSSYFEDICGATTDGTRVEKADVIAHLFALHPEIDLARTVMIGDRLHDIEGAHANHLPCIGVLYGFGSEAEFHQYGADYIVPTPEALESLLCEDSCLCNV